MTQIIRSQDEYLEPTKPYERVFVQSDFVTEATSSYASCQVITFENYANPVPQTPPQHSEIGALVKKWEKDETRRVALEDARRWAAGAFHANDGDTVRTLRLRKGWSQVRLAEEIKTSQSHIARIERGTENVSIDTCRRLCQALDVDMNTLDQALRREAALSAKANSK